MRKYPLLRAASGGGELRLCLGVTLPATPDDVTSSCRCRPRGNHQRRRHAARSCAVAHFLLVAPDSHTPQPSSRLVERCAGALWRTCVANMFSALACAVVVLRAGYSGWQFYIIWFKRTNGENLIPHTRCVCVCAYSVVCSM